jgi:hypothetical protein
LEQFRDDKRGLSRAFIFEDTIMDNETLTALHGSIAKWQAIADGTGQDKGIENCPLCVKFIRNFYAGCPVAESIGDYGCVGTPYETREDLADEINFSDSVPLGLDDVPLEHRARFVRIARDELEFLESLLPEEEQE